MSYITFGSSAALNLRFSSKGFFPSEKLEEAGAIRATIRVMIPK